MVRGPTVIVRHVSLWPSWRPPWDWFLGGCRWEMEIAAVGRCVLRTVWLSFLGHEQSARMPVGIRASRVVDSLPFQGGLRAATMTREHSQCSIERLLFNPSERQAQRPMKDQETIYLYSQSKIPRATIIRRAEANSGYHLLQRPIIRHFEPYGWHREPTCIPAWPACHLHNLRPS